MGLCHHSSAIQCFTAIAVTANHEMLSNGTQQIPLWFAFYMNTSSTTVQEFKKSITTPTFWNLLHEVHMGAIFVLWLHETKT
jgi:hypothetical protein